MQSLLDRRLPLRTRLDLLAADVRRTRAARKLHGVRYGPGTVYLTDADFAVDRASFTFAVAEANYATDYAGVVVLDIGAHKGYYAAFAIAHGARSVVSYEPEAANLAVLEHTVAGYCRAEASWEIRRAAVDAVGGRADLHVMSSSWGHALRPPESFAQHEVGLEAVEVLALGDVLAESAALANGEKRVVVKLNIEGAECSAVLGTPAEAWVGIDEVFVETHPWAECGALELASALGAAGFTPLESAHPAVLRMRRQEPPRSDRRTDSR